MSASETRKSFVRTLRVTGAPRTGARMHAPARHERSSGVTFA